MAQHPSVQVSSPPACRFQARSARKRWGQVLIPGTVLALATTVSAITVSAITEPAIAGDSTRSMPANREGGGSRDACQARRLVHLVPISDRFAPGEPRRIAVLEGSAPRPAPLQVRIGSLGVWTLPAEPAGIRLISIPPVAAEMLWESSPVCTSAQDPIGAPPARSWLLPRSAVKADQVVRLQLQELSRRCGSSVEAAPLLRAFALEHLTTMLPAQLSIRCEPLAPLSFKAP
ncbi:MAG: hypothetical protein RLZZ206_3028 [Cyanobacteriota bacterium]